MTNKGLLDKYHLWMMPEDIGLEGSKLVKRGHTTGIPGEDVKRYTTSEHCGSCVIENQEVTSQQQQ